MSDQTPTPPEPSLPRLSARSVTAGCMGLHRMIQDPTRSPADRMKLRAIHSTIAVAVLTLYDPARVAEVKREAMAARGMVGKEPTDDEVSDVYQTMLMVLDDTDEPMMGGSPHDA